MDYVFYLTAAANYGYIYYIVDFTVNRISDGYMVFPSLKEMCEQSQLLADNTIIVSECKFISIRGIEFKDLTNITSEKRLVNGSTGTLVYEILIDTEPSTLRLSYFWGTSWSDYYNPTYAQIEVGIATAIPIPSNCQSFTYSSVASPVLSADPSQAKPMGLGTVAEGGDTLSIRVKTYPFSGPVDIYFGLYSPEIDPYNIYLLTSGGAFQRLSESIAPWKANITGPIDESLFGDIQISTLPEGTYYLYLLVTPAGNLDNCYLWITNFSVE